MAWAWKGWFAAFGAAVATAGHAQAAMTFDERELDGGTFIYISGQIEFTDSLAPFELLASQGRARFVTFDSPGGSPYKAMDLGRLIRRYGLATVQIRSTECASACALAFLGGSTRAAMAGSIGVHRSSFSDTSSMPVDDAVSSVQLLTADIIAYMNEMGVDPSLLQLALQYGSDDIRYLSSSEMQRYRVVTDEDDRLAAQSSPRPARPQQIPTAIAPGVLGDEERARAFLDASMLTWSSDNGRAMAFVSAAYANPVTFYGKSRSRSSVIAEKRKFAERWPTRRYAARPGSIDIHCAEGLCSISALVDWYAHSDQRGKTSTGVAELELIWDPAIGQIVSEDGRVLKPR